MEPALNHVYSPPYVIQKGKQTNVLSNHNPLLTLLILI